VSENTVAAEASPRGRRLVSLSIAALGVVYGDIGTSPLYALRECLHGPHAVAPTRENVFGLLSLVFWSMTIVVSLKYLAYVLRAHNRGEGGILALMALGHGSGTGPMTKRAVVMLGLFGAALLYGDGIITPAVTVLGAVEGLKIAAPSLTHFVIPITIGVLIAIFLVQSHGTARIGAIFGPVMLLWFVTLGALGLGKLIETPEVLLALSPHHGVAFLFSGGWQAFLTLGSVFLVVTGAEALYADMGHFGARPIRFTWIVVAFPGLLLNYLGQGALVLQDPRAAANPFFLLAPSWATIPLVLLATCAAVIASQALISGAFSLTRQAIMLGYLPRLRTLHTSATQIGQIYVPLVNWALMLGTIALVLGFESSSRLAAAYGIAVTMTMAITTVLAHVVATQCWKWPVAIVLPATVLFLAVDLAFLAANLTKIHHGGWLALAIGFAVFTILTTWKRGREILASRFREQLIPLEDFLELMHVERTTRVPGMAVFMTSNLDGTPPPLLHNFKLNRVVHQRVALLNVRTEEVPVVEDDRRLQVDALEAGFFRVQARYGFMETPDIPSLLTSGRLPGYLPDHAVYILGRETVIASDRPGMALWRERLFTLMSRNAQGATAFFAIPPDRVLEIGSQVEL
jgi:KUP system potassium uptake protein